MTGLPPGRRIWRDRGGRILRDRPDWIGRPCGSVDEVGDFLLCQCLSGQAAAHRVEHPFVMTARSRRGATEVWPSCYLLSY
jgi:hypothetical protein